MAWQTTAPTLPEGSSYGGVKTIKKTGNAFSWTCKICIARLTGNNVSIKAVLKGAWGENGYAGYYPPSRHYLKCSGDEAFPTWSLNSTTRYWVGTLLPGSSVKVYAGHSDDAVHGLNTAYKSLTGPPLIETALPIYVNADGNVAQLDKVFANVDGDILEGKVFTNVGGTIREIK